MEAYFIHPEFGQDDHSDFKALDIVAGTKVIVYPFGEEGAPGIAKMATVIDFKAGHAGELLVDGVTYYFVQWVSPDMLVPRLKELKTSTMDDGVAIYQTDAHALVYIKFPKDIRKAAEPTSPPHVQVTDTGATEHGVPIFTVKFE